MQNTAAVRERSIIDHILHDVRQRNGQLIRLRVAEGEGQRALRICVNEQHPLVLLGKSDAEVSGSRGFTHAALLVRHRNHFAIRHMGFLLCINLAVCGEADGYVEKILKEFRIADIFLRGNARLVGVRHQKPSRLQQRLQINTEEGLFALYIQKNHQFLSCLRCVTKV